MLVSSRSHCQLNGLRAGRAVLDLEEEDALAAVLVTSFIGVVAHWRQVASLLVPVIAIFALDVLLVGCRGHLSVRAYVTLDSHVIAAGLWVSSSRPLAGAWRIRASLASIVDPLVFLVVSIVSIVLLICVWPCDKLHLIIGEDIEVQASSCVVLVVSASWSRVFGPRFLWPWYWLRGASVLWSWLCATSIWALCWALRLVDLDLDTVTRKLAVYLK